MQGEAAAIDFASSRFALALSLSLLGCLAKLADINWQHADTSFSGHFCRAEDTSRIQLIKAAAEGNECSSFFSPI